MSRKNAKKNAANANEAAKATEGSTEPQSSTPATQAPPTTPAKEHITDALNDIPTIIEVDVAVYGGGHGGLLLARELSKTRKVALIDQDDYFEISSPIVRSMVDPTFAPESGIPYSEAAPKVRFVHGRLAELRRDGTGIVELFNRDEPENPYGHLSKANMQSLAQIEAKAVVLATGAHYNRTAFRAGAEYTKQARWDYYRQEAKKIDEAQNIVIAGAGPVGVEFAAEIAHRYQSDMTKLKPSAKKTVTLVNPKKRVLPTSSEAASTAAERWLMTHHVQLVNGVSVALDLTSSKGKGSVELDNGKVLEADVLFWATGTTPNSKYMAEHWSDALTERGEIVVGRTFVVQGAEKANIFALGDVANVGEPKLAWLTASQWPMVVKNVAACLAGSKESAYYKYKPAPANDQRMGVTLGPDAGVFRLPYIGTVTFGPMVRKVKARNMFVPEIRKELGL